MALIMSAKIHADSYPRDVCDSLGERRTAKKCVHSLMRMVFNSSLVPAILSLPSSVRYFDFSCSEPQATDHHNSGVLRRRLASGRRPSRPSNPFWQGKLMPLLETNRNSNNSDCLRDHGHVRSNSVHYESLPPLDHGEGVQPFPQSSHLHLHLHGHYACLLYSRRDCQNPNL